MDRVSSPLFILAAAHMWTRKEQMLVFLAQSAKMGCRVTWKRGVGSSHELVHAERVAVM